MELPDTISTPAFWTSSLAVAGYFSGAFLLAEKFLNEKVKEKFKNAIELAEVRLYLMGDLFDAFFGKKKLSLKFIAISCLVSFLGLLVVTGVVLSIFADTSVLYGVDLIQLGQYSVLAGLALNFIPDYLSLIETRWVLSKMEDATAPQILVLLIVDLIVSLAIFFVPIILFLSLPESGLMKSVWKFMGVYDDIWLQSLDTQESLTDKINFFFDVLLALDKPSFLLILICAITTFLTSIWIWLYCLASLFFKFLNFTNIKSRPFESFGVVSACFAFLATMALSSVEPSGSRYPEMVDIYGDSFMMGCDKSLDPMCFSDETPRHSVNIEKFKISRHEVTFEQYYQFTRATNRKLPDDRGFGRGRHPVINVSWDDAKAYVSWLNSVEEIQVEGYEYRLPTEAQWEYAARARTNTRYYWGDDLGKNNANCGGESGSLWGDRRTSEVGRHKPNEFDLYDMSGNVWEWVEDEWHEDYKGAPDDGSAWVGVPAGSRSYRVLRGGGWNYFALYGRSAYRYHYSRDYRSGGIGLRVAQVTSQ